MWMRVDTRKMCMPVVAAMIALAWLVMTLWSISPYARFLDHSALEDLELAVDGRYLTLLAIFLAGWVLMSIAMMLPTTLPLLQLFRRLTGSRPDQVLLVALLMAGYLTVWTAFGAVAHAADLVIHEAVEQVDLLAANPWAITAAILALAGLYQFTPLKFACLDKCRSPLSFIAEHWQGSHTRRQSFLLGMHHGLFCVGCCWPLMLLMFAVSMGNVGWMLILGAVMAIEKNVAWGRQIGKPIGLALLAASVALVLVSGPQL